MFTFVTALGTLSFIPHQEPRFLIPLTLPIVLMNAHKLRAKLFGSKTKPLLVLWYLFNIGGLFFFGMTHQAGVTQLLNRNRDILPSNADNIGQVNIVFSHTYMPPTFQLLLPAKNKSRITKWHFEYPIYFNKDLPNLNLIEMGSKPVEINVKQKLIEVILDKNINPNKNVKNFVAIPTILVEKLQSSLENILEFSTVYYTFPHISVESLSELPNIISIKDFSMDISKSWERVTSEINSNGITSYFVKRVVKIFETIRLFGFSLIEVKLNSARVKSIELDNLNHLKGKKLDETNGTKKQAKRSKPVNTQKN